MRRVVEYLFIMSECDHCKKGEPVTATMLDSPRSPCGNSPQKLHKCCRPFSVWNGCVQDHEFLWDHSTEWSCFRLLIKAIIQGKDEIVERQSSNNVSNKLLLWQSKSACMPMIYDPKEDPGRRRWLVVAVCCLSSKDRLLSSFVTDCKYGFSFINAWKNQFVLKLRHNRL